MSDNKILSAVRKLIEEGNLNQAVETLLSSNLLNEKVYNDVLVLSNKLKRTEKQNLTGILSINEERNKFNEITFALLEILNHINSESIEIKKNNKSVKIINSRAIKDILADGDLEYTIAVLKDLSIRGIGSDELIVLQARLNRLNKSQIAGTLSREEYEIERIQLVRAILNIIDRDFDHRNIDLELFSQAITSKLNDTKKEEPKYKEAKLIIVGEPGSGKTSLMRKLLNENYKVPQPEKSDEESTVGINVSDKWSFSIKNNDKTKYRANIWDFGGQEIQYMTHQFFLTPDSLYVLVADDRKQHTNFQYWFEIIHLLGNENGIQSPILVVLNENKHCSISNFDISLYRKKYKETIINLCEVDLSVLDHRFHSLRSSIEKMLSELPHLTRKIPQKWWRVRDEIVREREQKKYLTLDKFKIVCKKNGVQGDKEISLVSRYLHNLGIILHFQDDIHLSNFIILNIKWALEAVYSILRGKSLKDNFGKFNIKDLDIYWKGYSATEKSSLLNLMMKDKFEICYKTSKPDLYVAPQLLQNIQPEYDFSIENCMRFKYQYRFMPKGILTKIIVRKHETISNSGRVVWQTGVLLDYQKCKIELIEEYSKNNINIKVSGPINDRKYALRSIRDEIEYIHNVWFSSVEFQRLIQCDCELCAKIEEPTYFDYEALLRFWEKDKKTIDCTISVTERSVLKLIEGVFEQSEIDRDKKIYFSSEHQNIVINNNIIHNMEGQKQKSSEPWALYSYLIAIVVVIGILAMVFQIFDIWKCLLIVVSAVLLVLLAGVLQLQNDSRLKEKSFVEIIKMILGKIPGLGVFSKAGKEIK